MRKIFYFMAYFLLAATTIGGISIAETEVKISARLDSDEVPFNREARLVVQARWIGPANAIKIFPIDAPTTTNLKLLSTSTANAVSSENGLVFSKREYEFSFSGETLGMAYIDEVILRYHDADLQEHVLRTARLPLRIIDPVAENSDGLTLFILAGLFILLFAVAWTIYFLWKKKSTVEQESEMAPVKSADEEAVEDLKKNINLQSTEIGAQYSEIARIMRHFLRRRFALGASIGTTDELIENLTGKKVAMEELATLRELMQACDLAKFSGGSSDANQLARIYNIALQFIEKNKFE